MPSEIKKYFLEKVKGPVFPIPTPFTEGGQVDYDNLQKYVGFLLDNGACTIMVTVGTSRFDVLTLEEMKKVNETVIKAAGKRAVTILTTPTTGPTSQSIEFAQHAASLGADGLLAVYPDRFYSDKEIIGYFTDIAHSCEIGVLLHGVPVKAGKTGIGASVPYSPELIEKLSRIDNIVGMKEESNDARLAYEYNRKFKGSFLIVGGAGGMRSFMTAYQWGQPAYLTSIGNFLPEIELAYYAALCSNNYSEARQIVFEKEEPFFKISLKIGWHLALKGAMASYGLMEAWERKPMSRMNPEMQSIITRTLDEIYNRS